MKHFQLFCTIAILYCVYFAEAQKNVANGPTGKQTAKLSGNQVVADSNLKGRRKPLPGKAVLKANRGSGGEGTVDGKQMAATKSGKSAKANRQGTGDVDAADSNSGWVSNSGRGTAKTDKLAWENRKKASLKHQVGNKQATSHYEGNNFGANAAGTDFVGERNGKVDTVVSDKGNYRHATDTKQGYKVDEVAGADRRGKYHTVKSAGKGRESQTLIDDKSSYDSNTNKQGKRVHTRVKGNNKELYHSWSDKNADAGIDAPNKGGTFLEGKAKKFKEQACDYMNGKNYWGDKDANFKMGRDGVKFPKNSQGAYEFPSCGDIATKWRVPNDTSIDDLAMSVVIYIPNCGHWKCGKDTECYGRTCFYKDLCNPGNQAGKQTDDTATYLISNSEPPEACNEPSNRGARDVVIKFKFCPNNKAFLKKRDKCMKDSGYTYRENSMEVHFHLFQKNVKTNDMTCKNKAEITKVGCRVVKVEYEVKALGVNTQMMQSFNSALGTFQRSGDKSGCKGLNIGDPGCSKGGGGFLGNILGGGGKSGGGGISNIFNGKK